MILMWVGRAREEAGGIPVTVRERVFSNLPRIIVLTSGRRSLLFRKNNFDDRFKNRGKRPPVTATPSPPVQIVSHPQMKTANGRRRGHAPSLRRGPNDMTSVLLPW